MAFTQFVTFQLLLEDWACLVFKQYLGIITQILRLDISEVLVCSRTNLIACLDKVKAWKLVLPSLY